MATGGAEAFLHAEQQAFSLATELAELKNEIEAYASARQALDQSSEGLARATGRLAELADLTGTVVGTLRSIGMPELLHAQEELTGRVEALGQSLNATQQTTASRVEWVADRVSNMSQLLDAVQKAREQDSQRIDQAIGALATAECIAALQKTVEQRDQALQHEIQAAKEEVSAQRADATAAARGGRNLALGTVGLLIVILVFVTWFALLAWRG